MLSQGMIVGGSAGLLDEEVTITRMIGRVTAVLDVTTALAESTIRFGCLVARSEAVASGVAALPSVEDDPDSEWLYLGGMALRSPNNVLVDGPLSGQHVDFDVRGQRVVKTSMLPVWLCEVNGVACDVQVDGRYLAKLA